MRQVEAGVHFLVAVRHDGRGRRRCPQTRSVAWSSWSPTRSRAGRWCWPAPAATIRARSSMRFRTSSGPAPTASLSVTPYYNKPTSRGPLSSTTERSPKHEAADRRLQRARSHRLQHRTGNARPAGRDSRTSSASRRHRAISRRWSRSAAIAPAEFIVLSGDDAMTLPLMAIGGRGVISVVSNEVPSEMVQMVEAAERGDFTSARRGITACCR